MSLRARIWRVGHNRTRPLHIRDGGASPSLAAPSRRFLSVLCAAQPPTRARNAPGAPVDRVTGWLGGSPRRGSGFPLCQQAGVSPKPGGAKYFPRRWLRASSHQMTGVAPKPNDSSFPFADGSELSSPHITRGFPFATYLEVFPEPLAQGFLLRARLGVSPPPHALKFSLSRVARGSPLRVSPLPPAPVLSPRPEAPESAQYRVVRGFPRTGGAEFPPRRSAGLPLARRPGVVLCRVARGFPFAGYRPWW